MKRFALGIVTGYPAGGVVRLFQHGSNCSDTSPDDNFYGDSGQGRTRPDLYTCAASGSHHASSGPDHNCTFVGSARNIFL